MPNKLAEIIALQCGIGVRYGCHCSHLIVKHVLRISPFLEKFQWLIQKLFPKFRFLGVVRVSFGIATSAEEVDKLIEALNELAARKNSSSGNKSALLPQPIVQKQVDEFIESISRKVYICEPVIK
jgi:hypothetical protein